MVDNIRALNAPQEQPQPQQPVTFPQKVIQVTPNGELIVAVLLAPDIVQSQITFSSTDVANILVLYKEAMKQQHMALQMIRHVSETRN